MGGSAGSSAATTYVRAAGGSVGHGVADQRGVHELFEADDQAAAHDEVVGDPDVDVLAGGLFAAV